MSSVRKKGFVRRDPGPEVPHIFVKTVNRYKEQCCACKQLIYEQDKTTFYCYGCDTPICAICFDADDKSLELANFYICNCERVWCYNCDKNGLECTQC